LVAQKSHERVKLDVLETARLAAGMTPAEVSEGFDGVLALGRLIGDTFVGQVEQELAIFKTVPAGFCWKRR
jgi:hypothetical protein